jgi:hypothetical protein
MELFKAGLIELLLKFHVVNPADNVYAPLIFAIGCAIIGILTIFADVSFYLIKHESILSLKHTFKNTSIFIFAWAFGAAFWGYIGQMLNIFQVSLLSCATVGISWPIIFTKVLSSFRSKDEEQTLTVEKKA